MLCTTCLLTHWGRLGSFKLFKRPFPGFFLTIITPGVFNNFNTLNAELNPICYLLALLAHHFLHVSRIRVKSLTLRLLMLYIYIYIHIYDISSLSVNQILCCVSLKMYNNFSNYFCELKFSRKYSPKTLVVLEGVIPLETFPLVEWH